MTILYYFKGHYWGGGPDTGKQSPEVYMEHEVPGRKKRKTKRQVRVSRRRREEEELLLLGILK